MRIKCLFSAIITLIFCFFHFGVITFAGDGGNKQKDKARFISSEAFLSSDFVKFLKNKEYSQALSAIEALAVRYPDDPLVLR